MSTRPTVRALARPRVVRPPRLAVLTALVAALLTVLNVVPPAASAAPAAGPPGIAPRTTPETGSPAPPQAEPATGPQPPPAAAPASPAAAPAPPASAAPAPNPAPAARVVLIGVPGLAWSDIDPARTPHLAALAGRSAGAALSIRTVHPRACPADAWLTTGAGARSTGPRPGGAESGRCAPLPEPRVGPAGEVTVPGMAAIARDNDRFGYSPRFGDLAAAVAAGRGCVLAAGPGAALATAAADGRSPAAYVADPAALDAAALSRCPLTLVDLGTLTPGDGSAARPADGGRLAEADAAVGRVAALTAPGTQLLVAGLGDDGPVPHLRVLLASGPGNRPGEVFDGGYLATTSTRVDGLAQITDLAPGMLSALGLTPPEDMVGAPVRAVAGPGGAEAVRALGLLDTGARVNTRIRDTYLFFTWLTVAPIVLFGAALALSVRQARRDGPAPARRRLLGVTHGAAVALGLVPVATFLAGLVPWERAGAPAAAVLALVAAWTAALAAAALAGPWRRHPYGPAAFAAAVTAAVLAADVVAGSPLQLNTLFGLSPLVAGRFYGFGNVAWVVFAMAVLLAAAWPAGRLAAAGRRRAAGGALAGVCLAAVVVDGWPAFGSDFGGVLAMIPGFALLGFRLLGLRVSWARAGAVTGGAVAAVSVIAVLDWTRPAASRSHLGRFVQQVADGDAGDVLHRKVMGNLHSFTTPVSYLVPLLMVALLFLVLRPARFRATALERTYAAVPWLRPALIACWTTAVAGFAVNDSGIQIPAVALTVAAPLAVSVVAAAERDRTGARPADRVAA